VIWRVAYESDMMATSCRGFLDFLPSILLFLIATSLSLFLYALRLPKTKLHILKVASSGDDRSLTLRVVGSDISRQLGARGAGGV
jgi:hypothetical protein